MLVCGCQREGTLIITRQGNDIRSICSQGRRCCEVHRRTRLTAELHQPELTVGHIPGQRALAVLHLRSSKRQHNGSPALTSIIELVKRTGVGYHRSRKVHRSHKAVGVVLKHDPGSNTAFDDIVSNLYIHIVIQRLSRINNIETVRIGTRSYLWQCGNTSHINTRCCGRSHIISSRCN